MGTVQPAQVLEDGQVVAAQLLCGAVLPAQTDQGAVLGVLELTGRIVWMEGSFWRLGALVGLCPRPQWEFCLS